MKKFVHTIKDPLGFHARPAGSLVKNVAGFDSDITIKKDNKVGDAKRIFSLLNLGAKHNDTVTIECSGKDEEDAYKTLKKFMDKHL